MCVCVCVCVYVWVSVLGQPWCWIYEMYWNIQYTRTGNPSFEHAVRLSPAYSLVRLNT